MDSDIFEFYSIVRKLKTTKRQGWIDRKLNADSISDHAYGAMSIGWKLSEMEHVSGKKVVEMLLVHDWIMSSIPDVTPKSGRYTEKDSLEENAKTNIVNALGNTLGKRYLELFGEFKRQDTREAKVAREADKLDTLLQADTYEQETGRNDILDEFLETYSTTFTSISGKSLFEEIKQRHQSRK